MFNHEDYVQIISAVLPNIIDNTVTRWYDDGEYLSLLEAKNA